MQKVWNKGLLDEIDHDISLHAETTDSIYNVEKVCNGDGDSRCKILTISSKNDGHDGKGGSCKPGDTSEKCRVVTVTDHGKNGGKTVTTREQSSFSSSSSLFGDDALSGSGGTADLLMKSIFDSLGGLSRDFDEYTGLPDFGHEPNYGGGYDDWDQYGGHGHDDYWSAAGPSHSFSNNNQRQNRGGYFGGGRDHWGPSQPSYGDRYHHH